MSVLSLSASSQHAKQAGPFVLPALAGLVAALAMVGLYLGILSALQSPAHAAEQLATDALWVGLVALGFGAQIGMFTHLRIVLRAAKAVGATAVTGAGTGASTLGMLACCAHHLTDLAPLVALTGASGLSGAIGFLTEWKYAFIVFGVGMNAVGIIVTAQTIRKHKAHLDAMIKSSAELNTTPICH
jgi:hypothetical protein